MRITGQRFIQQNLFQKPKWKLILLRVVLFLLLEAFSISNSGIMIFSWAATIQEIFSGIISLLNIKKTALIHLPILYILFINRGRMKWLRPLSKPGRMAKPTYPSFQI
ncbi:DUF418 domain-containing protein [Hanamia caeni]|uniref:DUF418 domain-containing protein n=1 Tax=Hanamia caeni TaxID=2294116 RepID=A0A3M9NPE8_9BACT|nr:DUF418 domain-containing protein [Hanamia caeni]